MSGGNIAIGGGILGVIALVVNFLLGGDTSSLPLPTQNQPLSAEQQAAQEEQAQFIKVVLRETELVWNDIFQRELGTDYAEPVLQLYTGSTQTACGYGSAAAGPFYCPADQKVYIDLSFYDELTTKFGASGDFAMAYVVAHEVGHHIQKIRGLSDKMARLRQQVSQEEYNKYSVMLELQADFLAGVWAYYVKGKGLLDAGDVEEALRAANAIGDDALQKKAQGYVVPESFTHGSSAQRMYWFNKGFQTGDINQGDTFSDPSLR